MENKYEINCDYEVVLLLSDNSEMLIGGSEKAINKALKNPDAPNFAVKDLDIFFREQSLGMFALDLCRSFTESEKIQEQVDRLYANLKDENTNKSRVAETLNTLDYIFKVDKSTSVRLLARVVLKMYRAVTGLYMNARFGLGMKQADRAELGEQFRKDVETMISDTFTTLKKKKSPQNTEILSVIRFGCGDVADLLTEYLRFLESRKKFCIECRLCGSYFLAKSRNTLYCEECRLLRRKNSKAVYREKCSEGVFNLRQRVKYGFENFMHKKKGWNRLSDDEKAEYRALHDEFVARSGEMLREYEKSGSKELENKLIKYLSETDNFRNTLENKG
jgi:hypothetical protein